MITCKACKESLPESEFYKSSRTISGLRGSCKKCCSTQAKIRYDKKKVFAGHNQQNLSMPTQKELKEMFDYHPDGGFIRKIPRGTQKVGDSVFGKLEANGYRRTPINYSLYLIHRLIWRWHYGDEPEFIDHINHDRTDNRIENLRKVSKSENARHQVLPSNNTSGFYGIRWHEYYAQKGVWVVSVTVNHKRKTKRCKTLSDAIDEYERIANKYHGEFAKDKILHNRNLFESTSQSPER